MTFAWLDYDDSYAGIVEGWLDEDAVRFTGCDDGWTPFIEYWLNDSETALGENFFCKIICESGSPVAVITLALHEGSLTVMEFIADPAKRGRGIGSAALRELLQNGSAIIGMDFVSAEAVIYPNNAASRAAFDKAGFTFDRAHPDGDALYYKFEKASLCYCGHDCSRCATYLATVNNDDGLRRRSQEFYREFLKRDIPLRDISCRGGRSDGAFFLCKGCPFKKCCNEKGLSSCGECENQCGMYSDYREKYVNKCNQI